MAKKSRRRFLQTAGDLIACSLIPKGLRIENKSYAQNSKPREHDTINLPLEELAKRIREGSIRSIDVTQEYLQRIEKINSHINAVVHVNAKNAIARAEEADRALAQGVIWGPLHGVPFTIKDNLNTEGVITAIGTTGRRGFIPAEDATVVKRLRSAGGILLGKTNLSEMAVWYDCDNPVYGRTNNPYNLEYTPCGSSGGEAAAIAAGLSPFGIGNDSGGSIRMPCHYCGVAGLKDSRRIPLTGIDGNCGWVHDVITTSGPLARSVKDLAFVLPVISGPDNSDFGCHGAPLLDWRAVKTEKLRVAVFLDEKFVESTPETKESLFRVAKHIESCGMRVAENSPVSLEEVSYLYGHLTVPEFRIGFENSCRRLGTKWSDLSYGPREVLKIVARYERKHRCSRNSKRQDAFERWFAYKYGLLQFFENWDAIICPVSPFPALPHRKIADYFPEVSCYAFMVNLFHELPAVTVRAGSTSAGLPIGIQIVAPRWREDIALALGQIVEEGTGGWKPSPLVSTYL